MSLRSAGRQHRQLAPRPGLFQVRLRRCRGWAPHPAPVGLPSTHCRDLTSPTFPRRGYQSGLIPPSHELSPEEVTVLPAGSSPTRRSAATAFAVALSLLVAACVGAVTEPPPSESSPDGWFLPPTFSHQIPFSDTSGLAGFMQISPEDTVAVPAAGQPAAIVNVEFQVQQWPPWCIGCPDPDFFMNAMGVIFSSRFIPADGGPVIDLGARSFLADQSRARLSRQGSNACGGTPGASLW